MQQDPRLKLIDHAKNNGPWDIIVVGGGATGLATAWDAASRGLKVAVLEQSDFAASTSSKSTKLIHGGVRYLQNGEIGLVREALQERALLLKNASEFSQPVKFILPTHNPITRYYYRFGMWLYDSLAGKSNIEPSRMLSKNELLSQIPAYKKADIRGGISYTDAQFDDAALAIAFAQCINKSGNLAINYVSVDQLKMKHGKISSIWAKDKETGQSWQMKARVVINATGIFSDLFRQTNKISTRWSISTSRGSHIVVPGEALGSKNALIIPKTTDGRVLFAVPWKGHTIIGTTDEATKKPLMNPVPSEQEILFLLKEAKSTFNLDQKSITSSWAGIRPLVSRSNNNSTSKLSRKHIIDISPEGLISILGGKWTTCRKMGEDTIDTALSLNGMKYIPSSTKNLKLTEHGASLPLCNIDQTPSKKIHQKDINTSFHSMYARSADDILSRRTRMIMLNSDVANSQKNEVSIALKNLKKHRS